VFIYFGSFAGSLSRGLLSSDLLQGHRRHSDCGLWFLGSVDSPEIREALLRCLSDADEDVSEEAAVGLGKRQDVRLLPRQGTMLNTPVLKERVAEAATALLGLAEDPPEWEAEDYKKALQERFGRAAV
jgi:HEAT repeat protein